MEPHVEAEIKQLHHSRGTIRAKLTRFENFLKSSENQENIAQLEIRLKDIETSFAQFEIVQSRLEFLNTNEVQEREKTENTFYDVMSFAKKCIQSQINIAGNLATSVASNNVRKNVSQIENQFTKLPDISLPNFFGTYDTWLSFYDIFKSVVHDRSDLSDIQKFLYLKVCCKQDALRIIENLEVTTFNYSTALDLLKKRYENKRAIVNNHVNALLFKLPEVSKESHSSLRKLLDSVLQHMNALTKLNLPTDQWDSLIIPIILRKLDDSTKREWENKQDENILPTLKQLTDFLTKKCFTLETVYSDSQRSNNTSYNKNREFNKVSNTTNSPFNAKQSKYVQQVYSGTERISCVLCNSSSHFLYNCSEFAKLSLEDKYKEIKKFKLCSNCLRPGHFKIDCNSRNCKKCSFKHNTLLHNDNYQSNNSSSTNKTTNSGNPGQSADKDKKQSNSNVPVSSSSYHAVSHVFNENDWPISSDTDFTNTFQNFQISEPSYGKQVLLSTATILIDDCFGNSHECTALLDSGSQSNLITRQLCDTLNLKCENFSVSIAGINQRTTNIKQKTATVIKSRFNSFQTKLAFLVLPVITEKLPLIEFESNNFNYPKNIDLADKQFNVPKTIDVLLGANIFYELLNIGKLKLGKNMPILQETCLGWIFTGTINLNQNSKQKTICNFSTEISNEILNQNLTKFWQIEEIPQKQILSQEAQMCEDYFKQTTTRNAQGRFIVRLPFSEMISKHLGNSKSIALKRFCSTESRLQGNKELKHDYLEFMHEYENLMHMSFKCNVDVDNSPEVNSYFLPHHAVLRQSSTTTKCRIVFDGSAKSTTDVSLNDLLLVGATVQDELFSIVLRLRLRKYVLNADIKMMYRQILVHTDDRKYQQILWRYDKEEPIRVYELNTVTYGTSSAPFQATRCLQQLAFENEKLYPRTCKIIKNSFYMDDLLVSLDSIDEALEVYQEITEILQTAGFQLRKWSSNEKTIMNAILGNKTNEDNLILIHDNKELKTLGIVWDSNLDTLHYSVDIITNNLPVTKRSVLSVISQIYDPLGLIGPSIVKAKILMQRLWQLHVEWDEPIPNELKISWLNFVSQMHCLNDIKINRQVLCNAHTEVELHGFSDASERAYGACIYLCSVNANGERHSNLLCAKSKVSPLKKITLPRLELLAAYLLARLSNIVLQTLDIDISKTRYYSDSTIVLAWLKLDPSQLKTFVANRVTQITELTNVHDWKHVKSEMNAADVISRGINPEELINSNIWWHGPSFLIDINQDKEIISETISEFIETIPDMKTTPVILVARKLLDLNIFERYSTLNKLQRVLGYICRFKNRTLNKISIKTSFLTIEELQESLRLLIKLAQHDEFSPEIYALEKSKGLRNDSKLLNLHPFLDDKGLLRVGGRLANAPLNFEQKHPIILPKNHKLTYLIVLNEHTKHLHAGVQNLLSIIRLKFWPINGKNIVKSVISSCIKCFRAKPKASSFLMGELPGSRVTPNRPFSKCGIDYAGPISVKEGTLRKCKLVKTYICIFVCFAVRAVHIELVTNLTTDSFLNALKRFISRRGKPSDIYSDNGSNFIGANNHFLELYNLLRNEKHNETVSNYLAKDQITWHFIPPKSPHVGGLWEAAVKSTKFHLRRILGDAAVSYEEMNTILTQIEACLNSRPLTPLSNDPDDYLPLTPSHFLIGDSLASSPQVDVQNISINRLSRYQRMQQLVQQFWSQWSREYLAQLQKRFKWNSKSNNVLKIGSLVVLVDDNLPVLRWPMARVIELHPGADSEVRVVTVKLASGSVLKRSVKKICILPTE